jgi:ABC-type antimicrobial peptide transport system permease subunit
MRPVLVGAVIGLGAMFWLSRLMTSLLFGIQPSDPVTYSAVILALMAAAIFACYFPARAVLRVDPVVALRVE